jgi:short chain dehydrogenase
MKVNFSLNDKVAIVTGGFKGIGRAIALAFAENGADIAIAAGGREALEKTRSEIEATGRRCIALPANLAEEKEWKRLVDETISAFGGVDITGQQCRRGRRIRPNRKDGKLAMVPGHEGQPESTVCPVQPMFTVDEGARRRIGDSYHIK